MVRFLVLYNTPENIEAFERHYHEVHMPLAKELPHLLSYTLSRNVRAIRGGASYYLIAELEWDSMEMLREAFQSSVGQATAADVANLERLSPGVRSMIYELEDILERPN